VTKIKIDNPKLLLSKFRFIFIQNLLLYP